MKSRNRILFVTGSRHLGGAETLRQVAEDSRTMGGIECAFIDRQTGPHRFENRLRRNAPAHGLRRI